VIISHALWQRRFHADPLAVGQTLTVNGIPRLSEWCRTR
jgi:hypothetical protein